MKQQLKYQTNYGVYSAQSYGESSNTNIKYDNSSSSMSLISRKMLTADEVLRIQSPIILVMIAGEYSAILYVPDISKMYFNNPTDILNMIGITGTKGKSTTAYYIKSILDSYMKEVDGTDTAILSSINNRTYET